MADPINPTNSTEAEYIIPPNTDAEKLKAQLATAARDIGLVVTVGTALLGILKTHDWAELIVFVQSSDFITAAGFIGAAGIVVWRQINSRRAVKVAAIAATTPANTVVKVKDQ